MPQTVTIRSLPAAFEIMKGMQAQGLEWGEDYRPLGRDALVEILEGRMEEWLDERLTGMASQAVADRRNGHYRRHLLTELGDIELSVPRTRTFSAVRVVRPRDYYPCAARLAVPTIRLGFLSPERANREPGDVRPA